MYWDQNKRQIWFPEEIPVSKDVKSWKLLSEIFQTTYKKSTSGLTLLDTLQGNVGMPSILDHVDGLQRKALLSFMSMMENIHAQSYSRIFTTFLEKGEIDELFDWVEENKHLQYKANRIAHFYENIKTPRDLYMAMVASVFLESFLFYSGFFFPLWLAGQGKMVSSGEIFNLIIRDEAIHGVYVGLLAQELLESFSTDEQMELKLEVHTLLNDLMRNEFAYTEELYTEAGLTHEVKQFLMYNANKALINLGYDEVFEHDEVNAIVMNGLNVNTRTHDFFSVKGNGYQKNAIEHLTDDDFKFDFEEEII
jgi:ribonucleoside-diphosphate reductase beta chain